MLPSKRQQSYSKVFKADLFGLMFLSMKIGKRKTILWSGTKGRQKILLVRWDRPSPYTQKNPPKNHSTLHSTIYSFVYKQFGAERFDAQTFQQLVTTRLQILDCDGFIFSHPYPSAHIHRQIFFAIPKLFFPKSWIFFTICAGKVCYKVCNMYYKVCNMRYKVSNMCYKLCNKNFLIG